MKKKVFVGRENELEMFRSSMRKLTAKEFPGEDFARTFMVYGVGGMGKTSLCNRFIKIVSEEFPTVHPVFVDWDLCKNHGSTFTPEELLDAVARELEKKFHSEMKPYSGAKKDIKEEQEKIQKALDRNMQFLERVGADVGKVTTAGTANPILGSLVSTGLSFLGKGLSAVDEKILKERAGISDDKWRLFKDPAAALADRLLECIEKITAKKERRLILVLDTCELIAETEEWFTERFLVKLINENQNVALVFSGRNNPYSQRSIKIGGQASEIREIRGMADLLSFSPYSIDMLVFSRKDIEKYFKEMGLVTVDERVTDFVQTYSRGVPYAVDLLTNAMERMGTERFVKDFDAEEFREQLKKTSSEEDVIRCISRRFLKYCLDEPGEKQDRDRIFFIAALQDMDSAILKVVWGVEKPFDLLQELQAKYALFIRDNKLHDAVRDFLVEYLIENKNLRDDVIRPAMEKALPIYRQKYEAECEMEPVWEDRAREPRWKEALLKLMNALAWYSPDEAAEFFIQRGIELFLIAPSLVRELKYPLDKFLETGNEVHGRDRKKILALMDALSVFEWWIWRDKDRKELPRVLSFCNKALDEWKPGPVHAVVLQLIKGRTEYHQENYDSAFTTLLEKVDNTLLDKSLKNKLAEAHNDVGKKLSLNENNLFFFSDKALRAFTRAVQLNDKKSSYFYCLGVMFYFEKNYDKAIEMYQKAIELDPKFAHAYNGSGNLYWDLKDYEKALDMYQKAIELDPKLTLAYNGSGTVYMDLKKYDKAIEMYQKAIELDPKYVYPYNGLGIVYGILKDYDKAFKMFQKAIEIDPKDAYPYNGLGYLYLQLGRYPEAVNHLKKSIEIKPDIVWYVNLGIAYYRLDDVDSGISYFEKALSLSLDISPINTHSLLNKVTALSGVGRDEEALALLDQIVKNPVPPGYKNELLTDWNLLAGAPKPPKGITAVIRKAEEMWGRDLEAGVRKKIE